MKTLLLPVLAAALLFLGAGDTPVVAAAWMLPVFLLRLFRTTRPLIAWPLALVAVVCAQFFALRGMSPVPPALVLVTTLITVTIDLLPYVLDRWLNRRFGALAATAILPAAAVTIVGLSGAIGIQTWASLGFIPLDEPRLLQLASLTGALGFLALAFWLAAVVNLVWERGLQAPESRRALAVALVSVVVIYGYGAVRLSLRGEPDESVRVAGLTPPPELYEQLMPLFAPFAEGRDLTAAERDGLQDLTRRTADRLLRESAAQADAGAVVVAWSEAAVPALASEEAAILARARDVAREHDVYLAVALGIVEDDFAERAGRGEPFVRNKLSMIAPDGTIVWEYLKSRLVPYSFESGTSVPGDGVLHNVETPAGTVSGAICYDLDDAALMRPAGRAGVRLLLAPSNDWPQIRHMHSGVARLRAVENGFALLRPTSNGLSIATDAYGRTVAEVDYFASGGGALVAEIPVRSVATLYSRVGDVVAYAAVPALLGFVIVGGFRRRGQPAARAPVSAAKPA